MIWSPVLHVISILLYVSQQRLWTGSGIGKNKEMVKHLQSYGVIRSQKVTEVMETIDRALFVPEGTPPYVDSPMQIGYNATISAPHMHAMCLELLENHLKPGMHALDVGSGKLVVLQLCCVNLCSFKTCSWCRKIFFNAMHI